MKSDFQKEEKEEFVDIGSMYPPCRTLDNLLNDLNMKNSRLAMLCFLQDIVEMSRANPAHPVSQCRPVDLMNFACKYYRRRTIDMTHISKFRKGFHAWEHARNSVNEVLRIVHRDESIDVFTPEAISNREMDALVKQAGITNSLMSNLCFLLDVARYSEGLCKTDAIHETPPPTSQECHLLIRVALFFNHSGIDMVHLSKFRRGHQKPWDAARRNLASTLSTFTGMELSESQLFPEAKVVDLWGSLWCLHTNELPSANRIELKVV